MSDISKPVPVEASAGAPKKRGRKPKVRHDIPSGVPIDGDYKLLTLVNHDVGENKKFVFKWHSDEDRQMAPYRGYVAELWSPTCARPKLYFGETKEGSEVRFRELTLMKAPRELVEEADAGERADHNKIIEGLLQRAKQSGGSAKVFTQEVSV